MNRTPEPRSYTIRHERLGTATITLLSGPDGLGRHMYEMRWTTDYIPGLPEGRLYERGQIFHAVPPQADS